MGGFVAVTFGGTEMKRSTKRNTGEFPMAPPRPGKCCYRRGYPLVESPVAQPDDFV